MRENLYISIVPKEWPSPSDLNARSQLLRERGVHYTCDETWVKDCGWMPILRCKNKLSAVDMEILELLEVTH